VADGRCSGSRLFTTVTPGVPDGIRVDVHGNVWTSSGDGVQVFSPDGAPLGRIAVPEVVANLCFGGPDGSTLFVTATTSLYAIETRVTDAASRATT
jgi:gluconolactonase